MKIGRLFWGVFLIQVGLLFTFGSHLPVDLGWAAVWQIWPVTLILIGLLWLVSNNALRATIAVIAAILLGTSLYATINYRWWGHSSDAVDNLTEEHLTSPFDSTMTDVTLDAGFGAGKFEINGLTDDLISAMARTTLGTYTIDAHKSGDRQQVQLGFDGKKQINFKNAQNLVDMKLNPNPVWEINVDAGASQLDFDLSSHKVKSFTLDGGATSLKLRVGDLVSELRIRIDIGASDIRIEVPVSSGCEVHLNSGLTSKHLSDFDKTGDDTYRTPNFDNAASKIFIDLDAGFSSIHVDRY